MQILVRSILIWAICFICSMLIFGTSTFSYDKGSGTMMYNYTIGTTSKLQEVK